MPEEVKGQDLLPCPFCGTEASMDRHGYASCANDKCFISDCVMFAKKWNTRAPSSREKKMMDLLERAKKIVEDAKSHLRYGPAWFETVKWLADLEELRKETK